MHFTSLLVEITTCPLCVSTYIVIWLLTYLMVSLPIFWQPHRLSNEHNREKLALDQLAWQGTTMQKMHSFANPSNRMCIVFTACIFYPIFMWGLRTRPCMGTRLFFKHSNPLIIAGYGLQFTDLLPQQLEGKKIMWCNQQAAWWFKPFSCHNEKMLWNPCILPCILPLAICMSTPRLCLRILYMMGMLISDKAWHHDTTT